MSRAHECGHCVTVQLLGFKAFGVPSHGATARKGKKLRALGQGNKVFGAQRHQVVAGAAHATQQGVLLDIAFGVSSQGKGNFGGMLDGTGMEQGVFRSKVKASY